MPLTEPLVDVEATVDAMRAAHLASANEAEALLVAARAIYFADRTVEAITVKAGLPELASRYREARIGAKTADALLLVERLHAAPAGRQPAPAWPLVSSEPWRHFLAAQNGGPG
jgi:hypothetical protein